MTAVLSSIFFLVALMLRGGHSEKSERVYLHYQNGGNQEWKELSCDSSYELKNYNHYYLYVVVNGILRAVSINGKSYYKEESPLSSNSEIYCKLPGTYNPVKNVTIKYKRSHVSRSKVKTCQLNITSTWKCTNLLGSKCSIEVANNESLYASNHGEPVEVSYTITRSYSHSYYTNYYYYYKYPECISDEWRVSVSGVTNESDNKWHEFDADIQNGKLVQKGTIRLKPNNNQTRSYSLSGQLLSEHEIAENVFEEMDCDDPVKLVIKDPPTEPKLEYPNNNEIFFFRGECSVPEFKWEEPDDWGWVGKEVEPRYYINVFKEKNLVKSKELESSSISGLGCFHEGKYSWEVIAAPDIVNVSSGTRYFEMCDIGDIGVLKAENPVDGTFVDTNVAVSWIQPTKESKCVPDSYYSYSILLTKEGSKIKSAQVPYSETNFEFKDLDDGTYSWEIVTNGPLNSTSNKVGRKFKVCTKSAPEPPSGLYINEGDSIICSKETNENQELSFAWVKPSFEGKACTENSQGMEYTVVLCNLSEKTCKNHTTNETRLSLTTIPCVSSGYNVSVYANNGFADSTPATHKFSVCSRSKPAKPVVDSVSEANYCTSNTSITWSLGDWGSPCDDSAKRTFKIKYGSKTLEQSEDYFTKTPDNKYTFNTTLDEGAWDVYVTACTLDELCSQSDKATVNASIIPEINVTNVTSDSKSISFSWSTDSRFISCSKGSDFKYTLVYKVGDDGEEKFISGISVEENVTQNITFSSEMIYWHIVLNNSNGEEISTEQDQYGMCKVVEPNWGANVDPLVSPEDGAVIFGNVVLEWAKVESFGIACKTVDSSGVNSVKDNDSPKNYTVSVNEIAYDTNSSTTTITKNISTYGNHTWGVTARNSNASVSSKNKTFCRANYPPVIEAKCPKGPYIKTSLSWALKGGEKFKETCGRDYGYRVKYGQESLETKDLSFNVNESYLGRNLTWFVESYVGSERGEMQNCTTYLCVITAPEKPVLNSYIEVIDKHGKWGFNWTDVNEYAEMCGLSVSFSYEVKVSKNGVLTNSSTTKNTNTSFTLNEGGLYTLSVRVNDNVSYSEYANSTLSLCIPEQLEKPILVSPEKNKTILSNKVPTLKFEWKIDYGNDQCEQGAQYTLWFWKSGGSPQYKNITRGEVSTVMKDVESDGTYYWNITIESEYWSATSETYNFTVCTPSKPSAPVLEPYLESNSQEYTLTWDDVNWGEVCGFESGAFYNVYLFKEGSPYNSVRPIKVASPSCTFDGLDDGEYQIVVEAVNNENKSDLSNYAALSVCIYTKPGDPILWYPQNGDPQPIRNGINFDVVPQLKKGSQCEAKKNNNSDELSGKYLLYVNDVYIGSFNENELNYTNSLSKDIYRFFVNSSLKHMNNKWSITYVNIDGENNTSDNFVFYGCDKPLPTYNMTPPNNKTFEQFDVEITWEIGGDDFGHKCTANPNVRPEQMVILYLEKVNITEVMANQDVSDPDDINYTLLTPTTSVATIPFDVTDNTPQKYKFEDGEVGATYIWRTETFNGYDTTSSDTYMFKIVDDYCKIVVCEHGNCSSEEKKCLCDEGYSGDTCNHYVPKSKGNSVLGPALGGSLGGFLLIVIIIGLILFILLRKNRRKRVVLEGPGGDIRFSNVKVPAAARDASDEDTAAIEQRVREDYERLQNGASPEEAFVFAQEFRSKIRDEDIDEPVKAILYTYYRIGCGRELLKFFISAEVNKAQKPETLFRQNTPASAMFKHWSKIIGLDYLFACFSNILKGLIQHEVDAANDRKSDVSLQLFNDTCEVDPLRIENDENVEQLLAVNSLQLSLTVQRFATQIYRSVTKIPYEIKDVCIHIYTTIEAAYPGHGVRGVSAFLFLRLYNVSISVPEVYGLLKKPPSDELRRTLVLVAKVLQVMSLGNTFGDKEGYMKPFNSLVDDNRDKMDTFYKGVLDKNKPCEEIKPDVKVPSGVAKDSLLLMASMMNEGGGEKE